MKQTTIYKIVMTITMGIMIIITTLALGFNLQVSVTEEYTYLLSALIFIASFIALIINRNKQALN